MLTGRVGMEGVMSGRCKKWSGTCRPNGDWVILLGGIQLGLIKAAQYWFSFNKHVILYHHTHIT